MKINYGKIPDAGWLLIGGAPLALIFGVVVVCQAFPIVGAVLSYLFLGLFVLAVAGGLGWMAKDMLVPKKSAWEMYGAYEFSKPVKTAPPPDPNDIMKGLL